MDSDRPEPPIELGEEPQGAEGHSLLRNSVFIMFTTGINSILGYAFWVIAARSFSTEEIGVAGALISAMTLVAVVADLGTSRGLVQRLPRQHNDREWSRTLTASAVTGFVAGLAIGVITAALILPSISGDLELSGDSPLHVLLFAVGVSVWSLSVITDYLFIAERRTGSMVARSLIFSAVRLVLLAAVLLTVDGGALAIFGIWVGATAASILLAWLVLLPRLGRIFRPQVRAVPETVQTMIRPYAGNYVITVGDMLPQFLLPVMVLALLSPTENAYFYVTWLLGAGFFTVSSSISTALFAEGVHDPKRIAEQVRSAARITTVLLVPAMTIFIVFGEQILDLFGGDYSEAGYTLLVILTASAVPDAIVNIYIARLRAIERLTMPGVVSVGRAVITLGLAAVLIPDMGIEGAGVAWLVAQVAMTVVALIETLITRSRPGAAAPAGA